MRDSCVTHKYVLSPWLIASIKCLIEIDKNRNKLMVRPKINISEQAYASLKEQARLNNQSPSAYFAELLLIGYQQKIYQQQASSS